MARFKRARRYAARVKKRYLRRKTGGGIIGSAIAGGVLGAGITFGAPMINSYVPRIGPISGSTATVLGAGIVTKALLHKDPMHLASGAIILGSAMAVGELLAGQGGLPGGGPCI